LLNLSSSLSAKKKRWPNVLILGQSYLLSVYFNSKKVSVEAGIQLLVVSGPPPITSSATAYLDNALLNKVTLKIANEFVHFILPRNFFHTSQGLRWDYPNILAPFSVCLLFLKGLAQNSLFHFSNCTYCKQPLLFFSTGECIVVVVML